MNIEIKNTLLSPQARSFVLIGVFAVMFLILAARVFYLQIIKGEEYAENFRLQIKREITLHGTRGNIYDKNGKLLAGNKIVYKKSGIELTESSPQVTDSYAIPSAIGQGTNNFSTVQLGRYVTTLANRGTSFRLSLVDQIDGCTHRDGAVCAEHGNLRGLSDPCRGQIGNGSGVEDKTGPRTVRRLCPGR